MLPDDDRYHASRDAGHSNGQRGLEASPSLTSPSLSDRLDSPGSFDGQDSNHRSAFFALHGRPSPLADANDSESAARRHASFSSVEPNNSKQYAATRSMLASMRESARSLGSSLSASANYLSSKGIASLDAPSMTPVLSNSTEDDSSERDSWPTSRCGRYGHGGYSSPVSTGPMTPEAVTYLTPGHRWHSRSQSRRGRRSTRRQPIACLENIGQRSPRNRGRTVGHYHHHNDQHCYDYDHTVFVA